MFLSTYCDDDHLTIPAASTLLNFVEFNHVTSSEIEKLIKSVATIHSFPVLLVT